MWQFFISEFVFIIIYALCDLFLPFVLFEHMKKSHLNWGQLGVIRSRHIKKSRYNWTTLSWMNHRYSEGIIKLMKPLTGKNCIYHAWNCFSRIYWLDLNTQVLPNLLPIPISSSLTTYTIALCPHNLAKKIISKYLIF